jgi:hypothetical protein
VDHPVVARDGYWDTSVHEFAAIRFAFVAKWIVFSGDDESWRQTLQFIVACTQGGYVWVVARFLVRRKVAVDKTRSSLEQGLVSIKQNLEQ